MGDRWAVKPARGTMKSLMMGKHGIVTIPEYEAERIRTAQSADCDAYEARIAELTALLATRERAIREAIRQRDDARHKAEVNRVNAANANEAHDAMARRLNPDGVPVDISALCCEIDEATDERDDALAEIETATKWLSLALRHLHGDDYTLDGTETISTLATLVVHALAGKDNDEEE